ncbi:MAG TPA: hypothetical protein VFQ60_05045 [Patescibacteria group bacterium]|nr:hypothetical protein [Patescibacteria group bacterium]
MSKNFVLKSRESKLWRDTYFHKQLGLKAAKIVEQILPIFEKERPKDGRPRKAMKAILAWAQGRQKLGMSEVRKLSLDAHAAARVVNAGRAKFVAHAAGHAIATWHVPTHALGAFFYAGKALAVKNTVSRRAES